MAKCLVCEALGYLGVVEDKTQITHTKSMFFLLCKCQFRFLKKTVFLYNKITAPHKVTQKTMDNGAPLQMLMECLKVEFYLFLCMATQLSHVAFFHTALHLTAVRKHERGAQKTIVFLCPCGELHFSNVKNYALYKCEPALNVGLKHMTTLVMTVILYCTLLPKQSNTFGFCVF